MLILLTALEGIIIVFLYLELLTYKKACANYDETCSIWRNTHRTTIKIIKQKDEEIQRLHERIADVAAKKK